MSTVYHINADIKFCDGEADCQEEEDEPVCDGPAYCLDVADVPGHNATAASNKTTFNYFRMSRKYVMYLGSSHY